MSNINNHGVGVNKINFTADFQELTCEQAAAIQGGAAIELFRHENFQDLIWASDSPTPNIGPELNDQATSAKVNSGQWYLCVDDQYRNCTLVGPGSYPNLQFDIGLPNDSITSIGLLTTQSGIVTAG